MSSYRLPTTSCIAFACANPETNFCLDKDSCWNEKWFKRCQRRRNVNVSFFIIHRKTHLSFRPRNSRPLFFSASIHPWHIRALLCYSLKRYFIHWYLLWWWKKHETSPGFAFRLCAVWLLWKLFVWKSDMKMALGWVGIAFAMWTAIEKMQWSNFPTKDQKGSWWNEDQNLH